jgi:hypothetical protein
MKKIVITALLFVSMYAVQAQNFGELEWQKKKIPAVLIEVPQTESATEAAILQKWKQLGYTGKQTKGVYELKGIKLMDISPDVIDVYLKVERKSRREKDASVVYFIVSRGYENYVKVTDNAEFVKRIKDYTLNFAPWASAEALEREIAAQEEKLKSAEKNVSDLISEADSLQKKLAKLQQDIEDNKSNIEKKRQEVESERKVLELLKEKRKVNSN